MLNYHTSIENSRQKQQDIVQTLMRTVREEYHTTISLFCNRKRVLYLISDIHDAVHVITEEDSTFPKVLIIPNHIAIYSNKLELAIIEIIPKKNRSFLNGP